MRARVCVCMYAHTHMYVYVCVYIYIYIYIYICLVCTYASMNKAYICELTVDTVLKRLWMYVCMYFCMHIQRICTVYSSCIRIWIHIHIWIKCTHVNLQSTLFWSAACMDASSTNNRMIATCLSHLLYVCSMCICTCMCVYIYIYICIYTYYECIHGCILDKKANDSDLLEPPIICM